MVSSIFQMVIMIVGYRWYWAKINDYIISYHYDSHSVYNHQFSDGGIIPIHKSTKHGPCCLFCHGSHSALTWHQTYRFGNWIPKAFLMNKLNMLLKYEWNHLSLAIYHSYHHHLGAIYILNRLVLWGISSWDVTIPSSQKYRTWVGAHMEWPQGGGESSIHFHVGFTV